MLLPTNAKLTFSVPVAGAGGMDADGNPIANAKTVIVLASLRVDEDPRSQKNPGLDPGAVRLVGRAARVLGADGGETTDTLPPHSIVDILRSALKCWRGTQRGICLTLVLSICANDGQEFIV